MLQTLEATVLQAQAVSIHGAVFYDLLLKTPDGPRRLRFQDTFLSPEPKIGDKLRFELVLGNVTNVERRG
ncbi:MAG: hypothetical protein M1157_02550 [Deinococcus sp.]|nr:hypothetical protein [Deinococcus sp.]